MRGSAWWLASIALLSATVAGQAPGHSPWNQLAGSATHAGFAALQDAPLDVVDWYKVTRTGEFSHGLIETPHGLVGFLYEGSLDFSDPGGSGRCTFVRVPDPTVNESMRTALPDACANMPGALRTLYDPATDGVTRCLRGDAETAALAFHDAVTGAERWRIRPMDLGAPPDKRVTWMCGFPALGPDGALYFTFSSFPVVQGLEDPTDALVEGRAVYAAFGGSYLVKVPPATGAPTWSNAMDEGDAAAGTPEPARDLLQERPTTGTTFAISPTVTETGILVTAFRQCACLRISGGPAIQEGAAMWFTFDGVGVGSARASDPTFDGASLPLTQTGFHGSNYAASSGAAAAMVLGGQIVFVNPADPNVLRRVPIESVETSAAFAGVTGPAWWGDRLVVPLSRSVTAYDSGALEPLWSWTDGPDWDASRVLIAPPGDVYVVNAHIGHLLYPDAQGETALIRIALETGDVLQRLPLPVLGSRGDGRWGAALLPRADGTLLIETPEGNVIVLGTADRDLLPRISVSDQYPAPGETVVVTVQAGDAVLTQVSWQEGPLEDATGGAALAHRYTDAGARTVRVTSAYPDGRTGTTEVLLIVGGTPPPDSWLARAFARENQDVTFGVLGVSLTALGFLVALLVRRRRRSVMDEELRRLDGLRVLAASDPIAGSRDIAAMGRRLRADLAGGRLDDAQFILLDERVTRALRRARWRALTPYLASLSPATRDMLAAAARDAHFSEEEVEHNLRQLGIERRLDATARSTLARILRAWQEEDAQASVPG